MWEFNALGTLAICCIVLFCGYGIRRVLPSLTRLNIPTSVIGGLAVSIIILIAKKSGFDVLKFDTSAQPPLMIAFFTTVGFAASYSLLRTGGKQVIYFFLISVVCVILQNLVGIAMAYGFGFHPLFGVITGSVTMTGGPATALAFAPLFEAAGVKGAASIGVAMAMAGIIAGGLIGGPLAGYLIEKKNLRQKKTPKGSVEPLIAQDVVEEQIGEPTQEKPPEGEDAESYVLLKHVCVILVAMWGGSHLSILFGHWGLTLPAYVGAMICAGVIRNIDEATGAFGLSQRIIDDIGGVALSMFFCMALMTLDLSLLSGFGLAMTVILILQAIMVAVIVLGPIYWFMGRDYDAAVMGGGFAGFSLGTAANMMAVMRTVVERYGAAPRAFLVAPMVGAFFIDFANSLIITTFLNIWK